MSQRKIRPFAAILLLVEELSPDQKADLLDVLRGRPQRASKPKAAKAAKEPKSAKTPICATCGNAEDFADHNESSDSYHVFRTEFKKKAAGESK